MNNKEKRIERRKNRKPAPADFKYYFYRDDTNAPRVTICVARGADGVYARGVSICSADDVVSKEEGKKWARKRALRAHYSGRVLDPINRTFPFQVEHPFRNKSEFGAVLTEYERQLFQGKA